MSEEFRTLHLHGKGIWARPRADGTSELERAIEIARQTNATHILYKVAHGARYLDGSAQAAERISNAGLTAYGWMWLLLDDPEGEARAAAQAFGDGYQGFILNTEAPCSNKFVQAQRLARAVRNAGLDLVRLYNCSFPNITHHRDLPYDELNDVCAGGLMPMAYGSFFAPGNPTPWSQQAQRVIDEWAYGHYETWVKIWGYRPPLHPVLGPYHDEFGGVRMGPQEFQIWLDRLAAHRPTFFSVFTAAVVDDALLPLIRDFGLAEEGEEVVTLPDWVWVQRVAGAVLHTAANPRSERMRAVVHGTQLKPLARGTAPDGSAWLNVQRAGQMPGWIAEAEVGTAPSPPPELAAPPSPPPGHLTHVATEEEVNFRSQPRVRPDTLIGRLYPGARMRVVEDPLAARRKLGVRNQWLRVQVEPDGPQGWIAAWYVVDAAPPRVEAAPLTLVRVESDIGLNVRAGPGTDNPKVWHVPDRSVLKVLEDPAQAAQKIGAEGKWIHVETPSLHQGHVAAWHLGGDVPPDNRRPVDDAVLPFGECAWLFGIHGAGVGDTEDFRHLFQGSGKKGWVLFTETIGHNPHSLGPNNTIREKLWRWSHSGYGVIVRLNNGYHSSGTLPESAHYEEFAATCARYAELYLKRHEVSPNVYTWVVVIGNEQNNVREHPGGADHPREHITPQRYARAFNLAYRAVKQALPNATVVTGAVDPYNTWPWALDNNRRYRPMDYFREMLEGIDELDGFALHCYTHGPVVDYVTHKRVFTDSPLDPGTVHEHYYDFLAYRTFAEAIPSKWRDRPIYITESNHWVVNEDGSPPKGWVNRNIGWIRAAYGEIHRWNSTPHAQQIHALMIYRWQGDDWKFKDKGEVHEDFKAALVKDHRWRK